MAEQRRLAEGAVALAGEAAKAQPVRRRKVDGLRTIEAHVEATMVGARKGDYKLPGLLRRPRACQLASLPSHQGFWTSVICLQGSTGRDEVGRYQAWGE